MTYPTREDLAGRTVTLTDTERTLILRMLDSKWFDIDRQRPKTETELAYLQNLETLQGKLR